MAVGIFFRLLLPGEFWWLGGSQLHGVAGFFDDFVFFIDPFPHQFFSVGPRPPLRGFFSFFDDDEPLNLPSDRSSSPSLFPNVSFPPPLLMTFPFFLEPANVLSSPLDCLPTALPFLQPPFSFFLLSFPFRIPPFLGLTQLAY